MLAYGKIAVERVETTSLGGFLLFGIYALHKVGIFQKVTYYLEMQEYF